MDKVELKENQELKVSDILKKAKKKADASMEFELEITEITGCFFFFDYSKDGVKEENMTQISKPTRLLIKGDSPSVLKTYFNICSFTYNIRQPSNVNA